MGITLATTALIAGGAAVASSALKHTGVVKGNGLFGLGGKTPTLPAPPPMPDQTLTNQSQQIVEAQAAAARRGRASTVLTSSADTGDKLGP